MATREIPIFYRNEIFTLLPRWDRYVNVFGSTVLYGLGPPLSEVTWSCAFVAVSDQLTGRAV
jgi:hypothetical protein